MYQALWISPEGKIVPVSNHIWYARSVTNTGPGESSRIAYDRMFKLGWIHGVHEDDNLFLDDSNDTLMSTLENRPLRQRRAIVDYAHHHGLEIVNGHNKRIMRADENMLIEQTTLSTPEFKEKLASLFAYLVKHLDVTEFPQVKLISSRSNADNPFGFTGNYDHENKVITLFITDRHDTDILRSFAHEVIHHWQNLRGTLHPEKTGQVTGQVAENDTVPHYAQDNPWLRRREMEAYLFGNILFRDWQDEQRNGPPPVEPQLPQPLDENVDRRVRCKNCGKKCDYANIKEYKMGVIHCPNCRRKMDQEGNNYE